jgi:hypothetical protein
LSTTPTPHAPFTSTPTFTPTVTPTVTTTPTETPDPNKPSDATGTDPSTGEYTKTVEENGKSVVYIWKQFQFGDDSKNGIAGHWFKSWMASGAINLTGYGENCQNAWGTSTALAINMNVYAIEGQTDLDKIGYIFHPDRESEWNKYMDAKGEGVSCSSTSLPNVVMSDLFQRHINLPPGDPNDASSHFKFLDYYYPDGKFTDDGAQRYINDLQTFAEVINNDNLTIKVGSDIWFPQKGYDVYWIDENMAVNDTTMHLSLWQYPSTKHFYWKIMIKDGKLLAFIAPADILKKQLAEPKDESRKRWFRTMILAPIKAVNIGMNINEVDSLISSVDYYGGITGILSGTRNGKTFYIDKPFIDFTSNE